MTTYSGTCRGGPYDGKDLEHTSKHYRINLLPPLSIHDNINQETVKPRYGIYGYVLGQWIWHTVDEWDNANSPYLSMRKMLPPDRSGFGV